MKYVPWKDRKAVCADLKPIYQAATLAESEAALDTFAEKWDETYPAVSQVWIRNWENVIPIFDYPMEIRRVIYTTNAIESVNRSLRKVIKTKAVFTSEDAVFPSEDAVFRLMYLAMNNILEEMETDQLKIGVQHCHILLSCSHMLFRLRKKRLHKN